MRSLVGGVAATAAVRAWPFRVFSFPSQPMIWGGSAYLKDAKVIYAAIQQRLDNPPYFPPFSIVKPGSEIVYLDHDKKIHIYDVRHLRQQNTALTDLMLGGPNLAYDGPVYG